MKKINTFSFSYFCLGLLIYGISFLAPATDLLAQQYVNLLENPGMNTSDDGWTYEINNSNNGAGAEIAIVGYDGTGALLTGYDNLIFQEVDLVAYGYSTEFLDSAPIVRFADWIKGSGPDLADSYRFNIILKDASGGTIASYSSFDDVGWITTTGEWQHITHNFINYGPGLRSIYVSRQGWDIEENTAANEGVIMDAAYLSVANHFLNASGSTGDLSGWTIINNGGDGWITSGAGPYYQNSFDLCSKSQTVNLLDLGYTAEELDSQPVITIWEFFLGYDGPTNGTGFGDSYYLKIELRDASGDVMESFDSGTLTATDEWILSSWSFEDYGEGLRSVYVEHGGQDTEFWAGYYGSLIDATQMIMEFPVVISTSDISKNNADLSLAPNSVVQNGEVTLTLDNSLQGEFQIQVNAIDGVLLQSYSIEKNSTVLNHNLSTSGLAAGMYFIKVQQGNYIASQKFVVQ